MDKFVSFAMVFAMAVYLSWAIDWDDHPPVPSYWDLLENIQSETAKTRAATIRDVCARNPRHEVCR